MQIHTKTYQKYFGYTIADFGACEVCGAGAVDIHHIKPRSLQGGNEIENLAALCRECHRLAHDNKLPTLKSIHNDTIRLFKKNL